jgi:hypothetical protein
MIPKAFQEVSRLLHRLAAVALLVGIAAGTVRAAEALYASGNIAIGGYDPVAYFTEGKPARGSPEFSYTWLGAAWHFVTAEHRDAFVNDPIRYAPQYGGFCTLSVGDGHSHSANPLAWRIVDGKLYLFGGTYGLEKDFDAVSEDAIARADAHWPAVKAKTVGN